MASAPADRPGHPDAGAGGDWLVACLCAAWCGVCRDYAAPFAELGAAHPQLRFAWVDVEDQAELVDPLDIDDFPTLLIARGDTALFLGTVRPRRAALERLLQDCLAGTPQAAVPSEAAPLLARLRASL